MGNKSRSSITINSSILGVASITTLKAADISVSNSITTNNISTENLIVNGTDVTQVLQSDGSLNASTLSGNSATVSGTLTAGNIITNSSGVILASGTINNETVTINLNNIQQSNYTQSSIVNPSPSSHVGLICVSLIDNTNYKGSIGLYTRGKMWNLTVYTIILEKNSGDDPTVNLNTETGELKIRTDNDITFEIKALNLFEK